MSDEKYNNINRSAETVLENIREIDRRDAAMHKIRYAHIKELAYELFAASGYNRDGSPFDMSWLENIRSLYLQIKNGRKESAEKAPFRALENAELYVLASEIRALIGEEERLPVLQFFSEYGESVPSAASDKVACVNNYYTDTAFSRFSSYLQKPSAVFLDSFSSACEDAASLKYEYCIVPIENSDDGKLMSFYRLLAMHGLKIVLTTSVSISDDSRSTTLALAKRGIENLKKKENDTGARYFEFCFVPDKENSVSDICYAAELFGMRLHRIDSATITYLENEFEYFVVLDTAGADLYKFLIYLTLKDLHYTPVGLYTHIK